MTTIAITGPTGVFGHGLVPLLEEDPAVTRIVGVARRPFDPASEGWSKLEYRRGDVCDRSELMAAFRGADAVAHLAFAKFGHSSPEMLRAINIDGTLNALHAAGEAGAKRFVFASSVAAYGFHADNPGLITEDWPARGSDQWFYSREKAEVEDMLREAVFEHPGLELTIFRPTFVVGPQTSGSWDEILPAALRPFAHRALGLPGRLPVLFPDSMQFVHEHDVGQAFRLALLGGPAGIFNLAGDGVLTGSDVARELGLIALPLPGRVRRMGARAVVGLPWRPAALGAAEALTHPAVIDATRAKQELGWCPRYTGLEALRAGISTPNDEVAHGAPTEREQTWTA